MWFFFEIGLEVILVGILSMEEYIEKFLKEEVKLIFGEVRMMKNFERYWDLLILSDR